MKLRNAGSSFVLLGFMAFGMAPCTLAQDASVLKNTGYIDLAYGLAPPAPLNAAGQRFIWTNGGLFVGYAQVNQYYNGRVSLYGVAGPGSVAIMGTADEKAVAIGGSAYADESAVAIGRDSSALGSHSIAIGGADVDDNNEYVIASSYGSIAMGPYSEALGMNDIAIGGHVAASGGQSVAIGYSVNVTGSGSAALGRSTIVTGHNAAAIGDQATATADSSFATVKATAYAKGSVAMGNYNLGNKRKDGTTTVDPATPHDDDPLLTLGNGTSYSARSNAFTVYRDGTVRLSKAAGGISMGQFN